MFSIMMHKSLGEVKIDTVRVTVYPHSNQRQVEIDFYLVHAGSFISVKRTFSEEFLMDKTPDETYELIAQTFEIEGHGPDIKAAFYDGVSDKKPAHHTHVHKSIIKPKSEMILAGAGGIPDEDIEAYLGQLPGIYESVLHPVHKTKNIVKNIIIDLNDSQGWSREQIADWLDTLDVDLRFKTEDATVENVEPVAPVISENEIKMKQLEDTIKVLMNQIDNIQVAIANTNKKFLALKEAIKNEQG